MPVLKTYTSSKFEHEASCRHGLRQALCLDGHGWHEADAEAAAIVAEALLYMGAKRPSWLEGQPEYTLAPENCQRCGVALEAPGDRKLRRFCSEACSDAARTYRAQFHSYVDMLTEKNSAYYVRKDAQPLRPCAWCGTWFRPAHGTAIACSPACRARIRIDAIKEKRCMGCGQNFRGKSGQSKFCSIPCRVIYERATEPPRECEQCGDVFKPPNRNARYCSSFCKRKAKTEHQRRRRQEAANSDSQFRCNAV